MTARSLGKFYFTDGDTLERCYKDSLSGFREWDQLEHASDWVLLTENIGEHLSIDETSLQDDLFTFLSNKAAGTPNGAIPVNDAALSPIAWIYLNDPQSLQNATAAAMWRLIQSLEEFVASTY